MKAEYFFILFGCFFFFGGIYVYFIRRWAENWHSTIGEIKHSKIKRSFSGKSGY